MLSQCIIENQRRQFKSKNFRDKQINEVKQQNKVDHTNVDARIKSLRQTAKEGILPTDKPPKRPRRHKKNLNKSEARSFKKYNRQGR